MASTSSHRELHHRNNDGIDVWLMWDPGTDSVHVRVRDAKAGSAFEIPVSRADQRDGRLPPPLRVRRLSKPGRREGRLACSGRLTRLVACPPPASVEATGGAAAREV